MVHDLSLSINRNTPGFPGFPTFESERVQSYDEDDKVSRKFVMNAHLGTHIDAPAHFFKGGRSVDELQLDLFDGRARVLDLRNHAGESITADHLVSHESEVLEGDRVVLLTGDVDNSFGNENFFDDAAVLTVDAAELLVDRGVTLVANDFLTESLDDPKRPVHHALLGADIPIVEYLCNVDIVADAEMIDFSCYPIRLIGFEAAPVRAVADIRDM